MRAFLLLPVNGVSVPSSLSNAELSSQFSALCLPPLSGCPLPASLGMSGWAPGWASGLPRARPALLWSLSPRPSLQRQERAWAGLWLSFQGIQKVCLYLHGLPSCSFWYFNCHMTPESISELVPHP